ncbi:MAG: bifunctional transcriptional activator/DNA repair enzyme AdaA [Gammaproteobacteria bacterium]
MKALARKTDPLPSAFEAHCQDYQRIERALAWLAKNFQRQPSLAEISAEAGVSEFHFQRVFTHWVGISPKKFLQYLTLERAKQCLASSNNVLDAAYEAGLSGPGRLHDLFVNLEAVTPGEFKTRGAGIRIQYGFHDSPFGECLLMATERGICGLAFTVNGDQQATLAGLTKGWEQARLEENMQATGEYVERTFAQSPRASGPLKLLVRGTPFQVKVWEALLKIPPGALVTYSDIAQRIGKPTAMRAVGSAVGSNAISYLIPCHRVIRSSGVISNYRWGPVRKLALIGWEAARAEQAASA